MAEEKTAVIIRPNLENYVLAKSAGGKRSHNNGDEVASVLVGLTVDETASVFGAITESSASEAKAKYAKLNIGMQRMNLGNRIRGAVAKLEKAKEGSGITALAKAVKPFAAAVAQRAKEAEKAAKARVEAAAKRAEEKATKEASKKKAA